MKVDKIIDGGVLILNFGKIAYDTKKKINLAQVEVGWRKLEGNEDKYFTTTGLIWNSKKTDCITCGASVHEEIAKYIKDENLEKIIEYGKKYHLHDYLKIPKNERDEIDYFLNKLKEN